MLAATDVESRVPSCAPPNKASEVKYWFRCGLLLYVFSFLNRLDDLLTYISLSFIVTLMDIGLMVWSFLQVLKKSGWNEGTGLGATQQARRCFAIYVGLGKSCFVID